jgi:predicted RNA-binding protein with PIN domain
VKTTIIIDGYNLIHRIPAFRALLQKDLNASRSAVIAYCAQWMCERRDVGSFIVVFDGDPSVSAPVNAPPRIRVIFSRTRQGADEQIKALIQAAIRPADCTVVTDDREILQATQRHGAKSLSPRDFHAAARGHRKVPGPNGSEEKNGLTPAQRSRIDDELADAWGLR